MDVLTDLGKFTIGFDPRDRARLHELWDEVIDSQRWAEGPMIDRFEAAWEAEHGLPSVATASWTGGALAVIEAGATPVFGDCRRDDLCLSVGEVERLLDAHDDVRAVFLVHIGGHIAFDSEAIAALCRARGVTLLEDCAHAHGATWDGRRAGGYG